MKKGELIFWEIQDFNTTKEKIEEMGFGDLVPRNDYRTAAVKAVRKITKGKERMYRKFNDTAKSVSFGVFLEDTSNDDIALNKEMIVHVDKTTGKLAFSSEAGSHVFRHEYAVAQKTLDASQFRALVLRVVKNECSGISMRKGGGIYFVDAQFEKTKSRLDELFAAFETCRLHTVPIYDDKGTVEAIEHATSEDITNEIEAIVKKVKDAMKKGSLTQRLLDSRVKEADQLFAKIKIHESNLRSQLSKIQGKVKKTKTALQSLFGDASKVALDPENFMAQLEAL